MNILNRINLLLKETTCTGDIEQNMAKGHVNIIGAPKKRKRKKIRSRLTGSFTVDK